MKKIVGSKFLKLDRLRWFAYNTHRFHFSYLNVRFKSPYIFEVGVCIESVSVFIILKKCWFILLLWMKYILLLRSRRAISCYKKVGAIWGLFASAQKIRHLEDHSYLFYEIMELMVWMLTRYYSGCYTKKIESF